MLSKIVPARLQKSKFNPDPKPLKLVIMSATLNVQDLFHEKLFPADKRPPIVEAEGRQHRVTTHFALRSRADYVEEVVEKVERAHRKLPSGGILVFLTGKVEINHVKERLSVLLAPRNARGGRARSPLMGISASELPLESDDVDLGIVKLNEKEDDLDLNILTALEDEAEEKEFDISDDEDGSEEGILAQTQPKGPSNSKEPYISVHILPFHSQLPSTDQEKVFESPPPGARLIVLATNVAETSLTIPGIRYVFDTGRSKERRYNLKTGVQSFEVDYISKASAQQRAGRAGRTGPGHCWRLYTSAVYERFFPEHAEPEILRIPAESVVLQLKGFGYPRPINEFPFPTPPAAQTLIKAEQLLKNLGGLSTTGSITELGVQFSLYPLSPRLGKILAMGIAERNRHLLPHVLDLVSALAVAEVFITEAQLNLTHSSSLNQQHDMDSEMDTTHLHKLKQEHGRATASLIKHDETSDAMKLLTATMLYTRTVSAREREQICRSYFLRAKAMAEVAQLRGQLDHLVRLNNHAKIPSASLASSAQQTNLSSAKVTAQLNALVASGYIDHLAIRYDLTPSSLDQQFQKPGRAIDVPYCPLMPLHEHGGSMALNQRAVFIHPSSVLARSSVKSLPEYIVYSQLQRSVAHVVSTTSEAAAMYAMANDEAKKIPKTRMLPLTPITPAQISLLTRDTALLHYGKPLAKSKIEDLPGLPKRRECWVSCEVRGSGGIGTLGWGLPPVKVRQVMDVKTKEGWRVEEVLS